MSNIAGPNAQQLQKQKERIQKQKQMIAEQKKEEAEQKKTQMAEIKQREDKFTPFVKFCRKHDLKEKEALWADKRTQYFRSDDFVDFLRENLQQIKKNNLIKKDEFQWNQDSEKEGDETDMYRFLKYLLQEKIIIRFERAEDASTKKLKYPKRLLLNPTPLPGLTANILDKCFYNFNIDLKSKHLKLYSTLLITAIVLICLFPIWPLIVKKGIFLISLYLLVFMTAVVIVRLIVWACCRVLGFDLWILPNLNEECDFMDLFRPLISCERCDDGKIAYVLRIVGVFALIWFFNFLYIERIAIKQHSTESFDEVYEWGLNKMLNQDLPSRGLPGYESFTEEYHEQQQQNNNDGENIQQQQEQVQEQEQQQQKQTNVDEDL